MADSRSFGTSPKRTRGFRMTCRLRPALVLGAVLLGAPVLGQQPAAGPTLNFTKDPSPPAPPVTSSTPPALVVPQTPPAAEQKPPAHFLPRGWFSRKPKPEAPPAAPTPTLQFSKEAPTTPGAIAPAAPPSLHFSKDVSSPPPPPPTKPALQFRKEAAAPGAQIPLYREVPPHMLPPPESLRVAMQQPPPSPGMPGTGPEEEGYAIQLSPPGPQRVFRLESEDAFRERMKQEARQRGQRIEFPPEPIVSTESYSGRSYPPTQEIVEPGYVCYGRLYFEERNAERYDWDLGIMQPLVSLGYFYKDVLLFPYHYFTDPCRKFDCDAGYCLPGDPTPYLLYPPAISVSGLIGEAGAVLAVLAILPG